MIKIPFGFITLLLLTFFLKAQSNLSEEAMLEKAKIIHEKAIVLDTHVDIPGKEYATPECDPGIDNPNLRCDLVKMEKGGVDGVFLAVFISQEDKFDGETYAKLKDNALAKFEAIERIFEQYPDRCELALTTADLRRIVSTGKRAIMIGIENGYAIGDDLSSLDKYYSLGTRYITLSHWRNNQICDSSTDETPKHGGLSDFGREVVKKMNLLGIMCDASHIAESSFWDLLDISSSPIICSHSGSKAVTDHPRNLSDEQLKALAKNGGVVQIVAVPNFIESSDHKKMVESLIDEFQLGERNFNYYMTDEEKELKKKDIEGYYAKLELLEKTIPAASVKDFVDHIDHAVKIAGINHVGIGTDFDGGGGVTGFKNHAEALNVTIELVKRGYSEEDILKIWGGNLLRVWEKVEANSAAKS
ncbi:MAG: dipeptidase [Bacteroidetes bacterium]|nr:dipeptidase [Bacteroidota bacterium]